MVAKLTLLLILLFSFPLRAKEQLVLTLSGGVSLGSYEAGVLSPIIRNDKEIASKLKVVYGTSAGSINGLLTIFEACTEEKNLLWDMWIPVGLKELEVGSKESVNALFSRKSSEQLFERLRKLWANGFKKDCDMVFGVTVTHKTPLSFEMKPGLTLNRQSEFFALRIQGQGYGRAARMSNYLSPDESSFRTSLPLRGDIEDVQFLFDLIQASSAFPGAFEAYPISYCLAKPDEDQSPCSKERATTSFFIDGGVYNNGPVGLAYKTAKEVVNGPFELIYLNAHAPLKYTKSTKPTKTVKKTSIWGDFSDLFDNFLVMGRTFELSKTLEQSSEILKILKTNQKSYPLAGDYMYCFMGFVDEDFRRNDFYLGVNDGNELVSSSYSRSEENACFIEHVKGKSKCHLSKNLRILAGYSKKPPPKKKNENEIDVFFGYLAKRDYHFRELDIKPHDATEAKAVLKQRLGKFIKEYRDRYNSNPKTRINIAAPILLNYFQFTPPVNDTYIVFSDSPEFGATYAIKSRYNVPTPYRVSVAILLDDFTNLFNRSEDIWAFTPLIGIEYASHLSRNPIIQFRFGARGGYQLSPTDNFNGEACDTEKLENFSSACSGFTIQGVGVMTFAERIKFQLVYVPFDVDTTSLNRNPEFTLQFGIQLADF